MVYSIWDRVKCNCFLFIWVCANFLLRNFFFQLSCQNVNKSVNLDVHIAWSLKMCIFMCNMRLVLNFEINIMLVYLNLNDLYRLIMRDRAAQDNVKFRPHWLLILEVRPRIFLHISKFRNFLFLLPFSHFYPFSSSSSSFFAIFSCFPSKFYRFMIS